MLCHGVVNNWRAIRSTEKSNQVEVNKNNEDNVDVKKVLTFLFPATKFDESFLLYNLNLLVFMLTLSLPTKKSK